jgi:Mrp family chromosome partitioning ATPase
MVNDYLGLERNAGLTTALVGSADLSDLLQPWGEGNLSVLTSGQIPPNPSELLGSEEMKNLITRLESSFDDVIIDAPPLLPVTDAAVLSQHVGGVVVVVGSHKIRHQDLEKSLNALQMVGAKLLGIVLNRLPSKGPDAYSYGYYSQDESTTRPALASDRRISSAAANTGSAAVQSQYESDFGNEIQGGRLREAKAFPSNRVHRL